MKVGVYSMRDAVSGNFQNPTFEINDAAAARNFKFSVNNNDFIGFNAADFDLFKIGVFDTQTGVLESQDPVTVLSGVSAKVNNV